jgi:hypothetical protein
MVTEQRDYPRRAKVLRRVVTLLISATTTGVRPAELADPQASGEIVERILRRLAVRGFARHIGERYIATPLLLGSTKVVLVAVH